jgi:hypothetical protein
LITEDLLEKFISLLESEGLITKPFNSKDIVNKFLNQTKASTKVGVPKGYEGFAKAKEKKSSTGK